MKNPTTIALVEPFAHQPFHSIRQLCTLLARELSTAGAEVISITPAAPFSTLLKPLPHVQRVAGVIERLTLSPALLRAQLLGLQKKTRQLKRDFVVLLSDQSLGIMAGALGSFPCLCFVSDLISTRAAAGEFSQPGGFGQRFVQNATLAGLHSCEGFITPSRSTAQDLQRFIPGSAQRTTVAPLPLASPFAPIDPAELPSRQNALWRTQNLLPRRYFLHVGAAAWYKNRPGLLHLMAELKKLTAAPPALVLAGAPLTFEEKSLIHYHSLEVVSFENLNSTELNTLYAGAEALLLPSYFEGFGWPALEALACGTPLVITDTSSLAEHFSSAAALILPTPAPAQLPAWAAEFAPALLELLELPPESRAHLSAHGIAHAAHFSADDFRAGLTRALTSVL